MMKRLFLILLIVFCVNFGFTQTAIDDPSTTTIGSAGDDVARSGLTYTYTITPSWPSLCLGWGFDRTNTSLGCINGNDISTPNCANYFTSSVSLSGNIAYLPTTTWVQYVNTSGVMGTRTVEARLVFTATDGGGGINWTQNGDVVFIPVTQNFQVKVELQLKGPTDAQWGTNSNANSYSNTWAGAIDVYNALHTNASYSIYTSYNESATTFYSIPTSSTTPTITTPASCGVSTTSTGYTFNWSGSCTIHPNSRYEWNMNNNGWVNNGTSTSEWESLNMGENIFQVRYYDGCNEQYYTTAQCYIYRIDADYCGNVNHGGNDWTISSNTTVAGRHYNVGTFTVNSGVTATVSSSCHYFYVEAENVNIIGTIYANGAGNSGGSGGSYGGLWAEDGSTDGRGITFCWDKDNCKALGQRGGYGGGAGIGTGGGNAGSTGGTGYGSKQECFFIGDEGGVVGGGGGGGAGSGGSYGGAGGAGTTGGIGGEDDAQCGNSGCRTYSVGGGGSGGSVKSTFGTSTEIINYGSGGGGAGGGGRGAFCSPGIPPHTCYTAGGSGGKGGGAVKLVASEDLTCSGNIYANGTNGSNGGEGGENNFTSGCCSDFTPDCTEQTFCGPGGGGSGAGGGSGGGIMLKANCDISVTGNLQANGGNGGNGGDGGWSDWGSGSDYYGGKGSGGSGGGGGRVKIFKNPCANNNTSVSISVTGGSGGSVASNGRASTGSGGNAGSSGTSIIATASSVSALSPGTIDSDQSICYNTLPSGLTSTSAASGGSCGSIVYQWMQCTSGCSTPPTNYTSISGETGTTYNPPGVTQTTSYVRRAISDNCTDYSDIVTLTLYNAAIAEGTWVGAISTNWFDCRNWGNGRVPDASLSVTIPNVCTYYPIISSGIANCYNLVIQQFGQITVSGGTLNVTGISSTIGQGWPGVDIDGGTFLITSGNLNVSYSIENSYGQFNVSGGTVVITEDLANVYYALGIPSMNISGGTITCKDIYISDGNINHSGGSISITGSYEDNGGNYVGSGNAVFNLNSNSYLSLDSGTYFNDLNVNGSNSIDIGSGYGARILGNFTIASSCSFETNSYFIYVGGDFYNNGVYSSGTGSLILNGSGLQSVKTNGSIIYRLIFSNDNDGDMDILLLDNMTISNSAVFSNGIVNTGSNKFIFGNSATSSAGTTTSFVDGTVEKQNCTNTFTFPTGDVNTARDIGFGTEYYRVWAPFIADPVSPTTITVRYLFSNVGLNEWWYHVWTHEFPLTHTTNREYWIVNSSSNLKATLNWNNNDPCSIHDFCAPNPTDFMGSDLTIAYWDGIWKDAGGDASAEVYANGDITSTIDIPFGAKGERQITFGAKNTELPLPIELTYFRAVCDGSKAIIEWETSSEINNDYFILEKLNDADDFFEVARISGVGNSNEILYYKFVDESLFDGDNYYRLKQVDFDGKITVYKVIFLNCDRSASGQPTMYAYPDPFTNELNVIIENLDDKEFVLDVFDELGRIVYSKKYSTESVDFKTTIDLNELRPAVYNLRSISVGGVMNLKVVKK